MASIPEPGGSSSHPVWLTSAGRQAADLDGVWLVPLALPDTVGIGPAHHLPLLDSLSAGGRALSQDGQGQAGHSGPGRAGGERRGAVSSNPANAQDRKIQRKVLT